MSKNDNIRQRMLHEQHDRNLKKKSESSNGLEVDDIVILMKIGLWVLISLPISYFVLIFTDFSPPTCLFWGFILTKTLIKIGGHYFWKALDKL